MTAPTSDPILSRILTALCVPLRLITQDNGFYNTVAAVDVEPLALNESDSFPQILVEDESGEITDSTESGFQDSVVIAMHGYLKIADTSTARRDARRLSADIKRIAKSITPTTFDNGAGGSLVRSWSINEKHEIVPSALGEGFLEVIVRASCDYRDFSPPVPGI